MKRQPKGLIVEVPEPVLDMLADLKEQKGGLAALARKAGLTDTYLYRHGNRIARTMNEHSLDRVQRALNGETLPPNTSLKNQRSSKRAHGGKGRKIVVRRGIDVELNTLPPVSNGREAGLRGVLDGLTIGVEFTRRAVLDYLTKDSNDHTK